MVKSLEQRMAKSLSSFPGCRLRGSGWRAVRTRILSVFPIVSFGLITRIPPIFMRSCSEKTLFAGLKIG